jgi:hypothetical protein
MEKFLETNRLWARFPTSIKFHEAWIYSPFATTSYTQNTCGYVKRIIVKADAHFSMRA